jgi:hypothetical protein
MEQQYLERPGHSKQTAMRRNEGHAFARGLIPTKTTHWLLARIYQVNGVGLLSLHAAVPENFITKQPVTFSVLCSQSMGPTKYKSFLAKHALLIERLTVLRKYQLARTIRSSNIGPTAYSCVRSQHLQVHQSASPAIEIQTTTIATIMATTTNLSSSEKTNEAFAFLKKSLPAQLQAPRVAIVCGSGLGGLANTIDSELRVEIDYADIPHFPRLTGKFPSWPCILHYRRTIGSRKKLLVMRVSLFLGFLTSKFRQFSWLAAPSKKLSTLTRAG